HPTLHGELLMLPPMTARRRKCEPNEKSQDCHEYDTRAPVPEAIDKIREHERHANRHRRHDRNEEILPGRYPKECEEIKCRKRGDFARRCGSSPELGERPHAPGGGQDPSRLWNAVHQVPTARKGFRGIGPNSTHLLKPEVFEIEDGEGKSD